MTTPKDIVDFWYEERVQKLWFKSTVAFDQEIKDDYETLWQQAAAGELSAWESTGVGCLALAIVLDQFPLNMFRGSAKAFSSEQQAVILTYGAVEKELDRQLEKKKRVFLYMPLMHSENLSNQKHSVQLFETLGMRNNLRFAKHHYDIIEKFGRFPHRNEVLGRTNTADEAYYLDSKEAFLG